MDSFATNIRRILLALFALGVIAATVELLLLGHTESTIQRVPLFALALAGVAAATVATWPGRWVVRGFRLVGAVMIGVGGLGLYMHYRSNVEFELEMEPSLHGTALASAALKGATPALAPGLMAHLGLLALVFTYRHPALEREDPNEEEPR